MAIFGNVRPFFKKNPSYLLSQEDILFNFSGFVRLLIKFHIHDRRINIEIELFKKYTFQIKVSKGPIGCLAEVALLTWHDLQKKSDNNQYLYSLEDSIKLGIHIKHAIL